MTDLEIAQSAEIQPIQEIAAELGISSDSLEPYGRYKAKIPLDLIDEEKQKQAKLILVTAITPTKAGEGKTTVTVGLTDGLNQIGKKACAVLREPSLGPVFGMKGGAAGGGWSQVVPMEEINLHFTGDFSAIEKANNLLSSLIDHNMQSRSRTLGIDPRRIAWKRVMDMGDRALRDVVLGLGGRTGGMPRQGGFDITAASEVMAIFCLSESLADLKSRLAKIVVGQSMNKEAVTAEQLNSVGAMAALLKEAIQPNLVQTLEGNPAIIHGGPFANIAQGTNTVLATKAGLSLCDYVVTEAGFGADLGGQKFLHIKCAASGLQPDAAVVVATVRALKHHGGAKRDELTNPNADLVEKGFPNLQKHLENMALFGIPAVVAINRFGTDSDAEIEKIKSLCAQIGVKAEESRAFLEGGKGAADLAKIVAETADKREATLNQIYEPDAPIVEKVSCIAKKVYGAGGVKLAPDARQDLKDIERMGLDRLNVCMAKTQYSLSDNPALLGRPEGFNISITSFEIAAGAGFIVPICGHIMRMPGLPKVPNAERIDIDDDGKISGLS
jgi:formate--tetrahydrofolate ligase